MMCKCANRWERWISIVGNFSLSKIKKKPKQMAIVQQASCVSSAFLFQLMYNRDQLARQPTSQCSLGIFSKVDSNCTEHVYNSEGECQRSWDAKCREVKKRPV
uniref:Uncharacterized protein n=1 Tax=Photinus pyralis TaxID=7054 RepID=A0A1Y1N1V4_PHOPY